MRRKGSECTRISPDTTNNSKPMISLQPCSPGRDRPRQARDGACGSRLLRSARWTAARFYRRARASVATAFASTSANRGSAASAAAAATHYSPDCTPARNSSRRHSAAVPVVADESHKSEAVEECIRFMNSSSRKYR